jgi:glycosyltransferase involved in cell wall biosynthesis
LQDDTRIKGKQSEPSAGKHIVLVLGMGINERGWAKSLSKFGRVTLIQIGVVEHVEVWEGENRIYHGPETVTAGKRTLDEMLLGLLTLIRTAKLVLRHSRGEKVDLLITSFYTSGLAALGMRLLGKVRRTVLFVVDYLPLHGSSLIRLHRRVTGWLVRWVAKRSDEAWALSTRIHTVYVNPRNFVCPVVVNHSPTPPGPRHEIAYIGFPSYDHALEILFDIATRHKLPLNIIGHSAYLESIKHLAPPWTVFHGLLNDETKIGQILAKCFCGYAIYRNTGPTSYSYFGFPSKPFYCFASNVPIVITNVAAYNQTFEKRGVGRVVEPVPEQIEHAILEIRDNYQRFSEAIDRFRIDRNLECEAFNRDRMAALLR